MAYRKYEFMEETSENACVGNAILKALLCRNITQTKFADIIGTTKKSVNEWIKGIALPMSDKWPDIKAHLGVDICELILNFRRVKQLSKNGCYPHIHEVNCTSEAEKITELICTKCSIDKYSSAVSDSCRWLLTAIMGLTYGKCFLTDEGREEPDWLTFRESLESYLKDDGIIHEDFNVLSINFISNEEYIEEHYEYFSDSLYNWNLFNRAVIKGSNVHSELMVAISKVVDKM